MTSSTHVSTFSLHSFPPSTWLYRSTAAAMVVYVFSVRLHRWWIIRQLACFSFSSNVICAQRQPLCQFTVSVCLCVLCQCHVCVCEYLCTRHRYAQAHPHTHTHFKAHQGTQTNTHLLTPPQTPCHLRSRRWYLTWLSLEYCLAGIMSLSGLLWM